MVDTTTEQGGLAIRALVAARTALAGALSLVAIAWALGLHREAGLLVYPEQFLSLMLGLSLGFVFLRGIEKDEAVRLARGRKALDIALAFVAFAACVYLAFDYPRLLDEAIYNPASGVPLAVIVLGCLLEALRRMAGWPLTLIVAAFFLYGFFGHLAPGVFAALQTAPDRLVNQILLDSSGILGLPLAIAAGTVVIFVIFGQLLNQSGGAGFFTDLSLALMGKYRGGSAKIAILGSGLFGSISGSAVSNVATTGIVTIPLMKRAGYSVSRAGGIEAVASTGGQLMPPVMGASAFLMAEFLEIPYQEVVIAALVPALLYFLALFIQVDLLARRDGIAAVPADERPALKRTLKGGWAFPIPFAALVYCLFSLNFQPALAGLAAIATLLVIAFAVGFGKGRMSPASAISAIARGGAAAVDILVVTAAAGIIIGVLNETGLSFNLTLVLTGLAGENVVVLLFVAALISIVLGMGMPTVGVYVLLAALVAPSITALGVAPITAHLFVLYFGMMSMITPPVAIAAFAAASLAASPPMKTALDSMRMGWTAYVIPFLFVASPALLLQGGFGAIVVAVGSAVLGVVAISMAMIGYGINRLDPMRRLAVGLIGAGLIVPWQTGSLAGAALLAVLTAGLAAVIATTRPDATAPARKSESISGQADA